MSTLCIDAGRRDKLRPGDILGALTGDAGFTAAQVGKINVYDTRAYVALERSIAGAALRRLRDGRIKGRSFRVRGIG
jgi:ATP-independent RNA helicase DbpA